MKKIRHTLLSLSVGVSLLLALLLLAGHVVRMDLAILYVPGAALPSRYTELDMRIGRGQTRAILSRLPLATPRGLRAGLRVWHFSLRWQLADLSHALWDFGAGSSSAGAPPVYYIKFPIWCLLVPASLPSLFWLRRRLQQRAGPRGFALTPTATHAASAQ
jgi:hypothetical protein